MLYKQTLVILIQLSHQACHYRSNGTYTVKRQRFIILFYFSKLHCDKPLKCAAILALSLQDFLIFFYSGYTALAEVNPYKTGKLCFFQIIQQFGDFLLFFH